MRELVFIQQRKVYNVGEHRNIISDVFANGKWFCYVLEDEVRSDGVKVNGMTAIPADEYKVILTMSSRFKRVMPLIYNRPDLSIYSHDKKFSGIRAHGGNDETHTEGCLIVAQYVNKEQTKVYGSSEAILTQFIKSNGGEARWIIEDRGITSGGLNNLQAK